MRLLEIDAKKEKEKEAIEKWAKDTNPVIFSLTYCMYLKCRQSVYFYLSTESKAHLLQHDLLISALTACLQSLLAFGSDSSRAVLPLGNLTYPLNHIWIFLLTFPSSFSFSLCSHSDSIASRGQEGKFRKLYMQSKGLPTFHGFRRVLQWKDHGQF